MAEYSGPWSDVPLPDNRYQRLLNDHGTGVIGAPGEVLVTLNGAATAPVVAPFEAVMRGRYYRNNASLTMPAVTASSSRRIDRIVVRFDPALNRGYLHRIQGTPATTPIAPAIQATFDGVFDLPLARVTVNPSAPTLSTVVQEAPTMGLPVIPTTRTTRPGLNGTPKPRLGQPIWDSTLGLFLIWDGTRWAGGEYVGERYKDYPRNSSKVSDDYASGAFRFLLGGTWSGAPAGDYMIASRTTLEVTTTGTSAGTFRLQVNGSNRDSRLDLDDFPRAHFYQEPYHHPGGNLTVNVYHASNVLNGRIYNAGSRLMLTYLGRRS